MEFFCKTVQVVLTNLRVNTPLGDTSVMMTDEWDVNLLFICPCTVYAVLVPT